MTSVGPRFEHELMTDPYNLSDPVYGSRLVACYTLEDPKYRLSDRRAEHDSFEEGKGTKHKSFKEGKSLNTPRS